MTALADRPQPRRLRVALDDLWLEMGYPGGTCFRAHLEPEVALAMARDLQLAAHRALAAGGEALADLDRISANRQRSATVSTEGTPDV